MAEGLQRSAPNALTAPFTGGALEVETMRAFPSKILTAALAAVALLGCGSQTGTGTFAVQMVDAPNTNVKSIFVTVNEVDVMQESKGEVSLFKGPLTVDLLTLKDTTQPLGQIELPVGKVNQIRLVLADGPQYVVLTDGTQVPLVTPSGQESGVKLVGDFPVNECSKHTVTLDFDGENSIMAHPAQQGSEYILRPVVRVKTETDTAQPCTVDGGTDAGTPGTATDAGTGGQTDAGVPPVN